MPVATDHDRAASLFARVETIGNVVGTLPDDDPRRRTLLSVVADELRSADAVRPVIAADLLGLTEKTVRAWVDEGVLIARTRTPRLLLDPTRLHEVLQIIAEFRAAGNDRRLLAQVYHRLTDDAVRDRADLRQSIAEMRHGHGRVVRGAA